MQPIEHVRALCDIGPRPPTSDAEARAAAYAKARLEAAGAREVSVEPFRNVAAGWKAFEIPLVIGMVATGANYLGGRVWSVPLCVLCLYLMLAESGFWKFSLTNFLPKRTSQNVYGKIPPKGKPSRKLVVIGHLDTNLTPILFHPSVFR
jgi:acetylornithine deacetylase/succinyl-diaminopimelate desuccinylase-like protein